MKNHSSISIVIPSYNSKKTIRQCLNSVLNQSYLNIEEVIVVDSSDDGTDDLIRELFPTVKLVHLTQKTLPGAARNIGVKAVRSEYIAFTDTDCIVDYYWVENIMHKMAKGGYVVGGAIINGTPGSLSGTLGYLNEFSFFMPEIKAGFVNGLATANICYRKCVFEKQQFPENHFAGEDTVFHWTLMDNGINLLFDPTIRVVHMNRIGFMNVLKHQRRMGEGAGLSRIIMKRDMLLVRFPIISIFILPWIRVLRMYWRMFLNSKKLWTKTIPFFPLSFIIACSWSLGFFQSLSRTSQDE
jgi:glycosyltransferase involved in cell wall biosynthesis